jgi:RNA polymerase sigma-70 factor (ECF subfamily)
MTGIQFVFQGASVENHLDGRPYRLCRPDALEATSGLLQSIAEVCNEAVIYDWLFRERRGGLPYAVEDAREFLEWGARGWREATHWVFVLLDESGAAAAACDIKSADIDGAFVGYWASARHRGVATNAVRAMLDAGFHAGFRKFHASVHPDNAASLGVLNRLGFRATERRLDNGLLVFESSRPTGGDEPRVGESVGRAAGSHQGTPAQPMDELDLLPEPGNDDPISWQPRDELENSMQLVARYQQARDARALEELMQRYLPRLERRVRVMMSKGVRQPFEIDDIVQSALANAIRKLDSFEFREPASLIHWLSTIALNEIRSASRRRRMGSLEGELGSESGTPARDRIQCERVPGPASVAALDEQRRILDEAVAHLPEHYRDVLLAREYDGGSWDHVAEVMGRSAEACQMLAKRARESLYRALRGTLT